MKLITAHARLAESSDLAAVLTLLQLARADSPLGPQFVAPETAGLEAHLRAWFEMPESRLVVAEADTELIGLALLQCISPGLLCDVPYVQVEALYVHSAHRRRGAGRVLMQHSAIEAARHGAERIVTVPLTGARSEQRFFSGLGFSAAGARRVAETASVLRRLEMAPATTRERRPRALDELIARRRRSRGLPETPARGVDLTALAERSQAESRITQVNRAVQTRRPDSSSTTAIS
ncbi:GNAT family N-acetyltransferase [Ruania halotolerans]|uniref:GNAT family N-acetyltransferase n=1 Tax=Ruania halotolerans TaxID=2897773 RepID=UPI001E42EAC7|nr:GNAT family N-acetyltransferase [Ruania halotolerans]UFU08105.1 GNAT family N-acetyltransferase [Ruania halotolerans]